MNPTSKEQSNSQSQASQDLNISDINSIKKAMQLMGEEINKLKEQLKVHNHDGKDGTKILENSLNLKPTELIQMGNFRLEEISDYPVQDYQYGYLVVGKDKEDQIASANTQLSINHRNSTNGITNQSFIDAQRYPLFAGLLADASSGASTATIQDANFDTDELIGAQIVIVDSSGNAQSKQIVSNTKTVITIQGTWSVTMTDRPWTVLMPVYLGSASSPWRLIYAGGDDVANNGNQRRAIRLGYGPTSSCQGIYFGSGSPEGVVTAVVGSLYLRSDGSTTTTLYIKTSGTSSSGWSAK